MNEHQAHWQTIYQSKAPEKVTWYQSEPTIDLDWLKQLNLDPTEAVIDVGSGASTWVDHLIELGFEHISALDLSEHALSYSRQRLGPKAEQIDWQVADILEFKAERKLALWHDRAVFHFLTDPADQARYQQVLLNSIKPGAYVMIASFAIGGPLKCSGLEIVQYDAAKLIRVLGPHFELIKEAHESHVTPLGNQQLFAYFLLRHVPTVTE